MEKWKFVGFRPLRPSGKGGFRNSQICLLSGFVFSFEALFVRRQPDHTFTVIKLLMRALFVRRCLNSMCGC